LSRGPVGIRIRAFGMTARRSSLELVLASDSSGTTVGAGTIGVSIGITTTQFSTTPGIIRQAEHSIIATDFIEAERQAVLTTAATEGDNRYARITRRLAVYTIVPKERLSLLAATAGPFAAMPSLVAKVASVPVPSAASAMAERNEVFRRAEALASAAEVCFTAPAAAAESVQH
jgi:hypothetical protein